MTRCVYHVILIDQQHTHMKHLNNTEFSPVTDWFTSDYWTGLEQLHNDGDETARHMVITVRDMLESLLFHINNNSHADRIKHETQQFSRLTECFKQVCGDN